MRYQLLLEIGLRAVCDVRQPQQAIRTGLEKPRPDLDHGPAELPGIAEAGEHDGALGQPDVTARGRDRGALPLGIVGLIAVGKMDNPLREERLLIKWQNSAIGHHVVDALGTSAAGIAEVTHLDRGRPVSRNAHPGALGVPAEINHDVNREFVEQRCNIPV